MSFLDSLNWRFAVKNFTSEKTVLPEDLNKILEAIRMAPTSYGMQPFHTYVVSNKNVLKQLRAASYDQAQVEESSYYLVFAARKDGITRVDEHVTALAEGDPEKEAKLENMASSRKKSLESKGDVELLTWARNQVYIALGFALAAAAELQIDSCPMEGFSKDEYAKILDMPENLVPAVALALGYRDADPERPKFRFSNEDLFTRIS